MKECKSNSETVRRTVETKLITAEEQELTGVSRVVFIKRQEWKGGWACDFDSEFMPVCLFQQAVHQLLPYMLHVRLRFAQQPKHTHTHTHKQRNKQLRLYI